MRKIILSFLALTLFAVGCEKQPTDNLISPSKTITQNSPMLKLTSSAFPNGQSIPKKYTCQGDNINPAMLFSNVPANAKNLVLLMDDPDVPKNLKPDGVFDHWVVFNMPVNTVSIPENSTPPGILGNNGAGKPGYTGPCPPDREHRYFFRLYALDTMLNLKPGATKAEVLKAMEGHILEQAELMGKYVKS